MLLLQYVGDSSDEQKELLKQKEKSKIPIPFCCIRFRPSKPCTSSFGGLSLLGNIADVRRNCLRFPACPQVVRVAVWDFPRSLRKPSIFKANRPERWARLAPPTPDLDYRDHLSSVRSTLSHSLLCLFRRSLPRRSRFRLHLGSSLRIDRLLRPS